MEFNVEKLQLCSYNILTEIILPETAICILSSER